MSREAFTRARPFGLPNLAPDNIRAIRPIDPLASHVWKPVLPPFSGKAEPYHYTSEPLGRALHLRGYGFTNQLVAETYHDPVRNTFIIIPRKISAEEAQQPDSQYRTHVVIYPEKATLRLIADVYMQDAEVVRQQNEEGYVDLGVDVQNRHIMVHTITPEERQADEQKQIAQQRGQILPNWCGGVVIEENSQPYHDPLLTGDVVMDDGSSSEQSRR